MTEKTIGNESPEEVVEEQAKAETEIKSRSQQKREAVMKGDEKTKVILTGALYFCGKNYGSGEEVELPSQVAKNLVKSNKAKTS